MPDLRSFPLDAQGFPLPGPVIRAYRLEKRYIGPDGKMHSWTQKELAQALNVKELAIRKMENNNQFLDSMDRRRLLSGLLKIPPLLLGLGSVEEVARYLQSEGMSKTDATPRRSYGPLSHTDVHFYQSTFQVYSSLHTAGDISNSVADVEAWIARIQADLPHAGTLHHELARTLWFYHFLIGKVYGNDQMKFHLAHQHINAAMALANSLNDADMKASTMYLSAEVHFSERQRALARTDMDAAIAYAAHASPDVQAGVYCYGALAYALTKSDLAEAKRAEKFLSLAESRADTNTTLMLRMSPEKFLVDAADTLIELGNYSKGAEYLDDADQFLTPERPRRYAYAQILRAEIAIRSKAQDFDYATSLLLEALRIGQSVNSSYTIGYVSRLHQTLLTTSFGDNPQLVDLSLALKGK